MSNSYQTFIKSLVEEAKVGVEENEIIQETYTCKLQSTIVAEPATLGFAIHVRENNLRSPMPDIWLQYDDWS